MPDDPISNFAKDVVWKSTISHCCYHNGDRFVLVGTLWRTLPLCEENLDCIVRDHVLDMDIDLISVVNGDEKTVEMLPMPSDTMNAMPERGESRRTRFIATALRGTYDEMMARIAERIMGVNQHDAEPTVLFRDATPLSDLWQWCAGVCGSANVSTSVVISTTNSARQWKLAVERLRRLIAFVSPDDDYEHEATIVRDVMELVRKWETTWRSEQSDTSTSSRSEFVDTNRITDPLLRAFAQTVMPAQLDSSDPLSRTNGDRGLEDGKRNEKLNVKRWSKDQWTALVNHWSGEIYSRKRTVRDALRRLLAECDGVGTEVHSIDMDTISWINKMTCIGWDVLVDRHAQHQGTPFRSAFDHIVFSKKRVRQPSRKIDTYLCKIPVMKLSSHCLWWLLASPVMAWRVMALKSIGNQLQDTILEHCMDSVLGKPWDLKKRLHSDEREVVRLCLLYMNHFNVRLLDLAWWLGSKEAVLKIMKNLIARRASVLPSMMKNLRVHDNHHLRLLLILARMIDIPRMYVQERVKWWDKRSNIQWQCTLGEVIKRAMWIVLLRRILFTHTLDRYADSKKRIRCALQPKWIEVNMEAACYANDTQRVLRVLQLREYIDRCKTDHVDRHLIQLEINSIMQSLKKQRRRRQIRVTLRERDWTWKDIREWIETEKGQREEYVLRQWFETFGKELKLNAGSRARRIKKKSWKVEGWDTRQLVLQSWILERLMDNASNDRGMQMYLLSNCFNSMIAERWIIAGWIATKDEMYRHEVLLQLIDTAKDITVSVAGNAPLTRAVERIKKRAVELYAQISQLKL